MDNRLLKSDFFLLGGGITGSIEESFENRSAIKDIEGHNLNTKIACPINQYFYHFIAKTYGLKLFLGDHLESIYACAGKNLETKCHVYDVRKKEHKWVPLKDQFRVSRLYSAHAYIPSKGEWITGGIGKSSSSSYVKNQIISPGPKLPFGVEKHCLVRLNSSYILLIGGDTTKEAFSNKVWFYDTHRGIWKDRAMRIRYGRKYHACGLFRNDVIVVGGRVLVEYSRKSYYKQTDSTEVFVAELGMWLSGPRLKIPLEKAAVAYTKSHLIVAGGYNFDIGYSNKVFSYSSLTWRLISTENVIQPPRRLSAALFVPRDFMNCGDAFARASSNYQRNEEQILLPNPSNNPSHNRGSFSIYESLSRKKRKASSFLFKEYNISHLGGILMLGGSWRNQSISSRVNLIEFLNCSPSMIFPEFPLQTRSAIGYATADIPLPVVCAGINFEKACYQLISNEWSRLRGTFKSSRLYSAMVQVPGRGLWLTGGRASPKTSEIILEREQTSEKTGIEDGPNLVVGMEKHCAVQILNSLTIFVGGIIDGRPYSNSTYLYDWSLKEWKRAEDLRLGRIVPGCAVFQQSKIIVAGGYIRDSNSSTPTTSTEILDLSNNENWIRGPDLPFPLKDIAMNYGPDDRLIVIGGYDSLNGYSSRMFILSENKWKISEIPLTFGTKGGLVLFLPKNPYLCRESWNGTYT